MNWKIPVGVILSVGLAGVLLAHSHRARSVRHHALSSFQKEIAGLNVRLVAVTEPLNEPGMRVADHAWNPDGTPYEGPEARLVHGGSGGVNQGSVLRGLVFELDQHRSSSGEVIDPKGADVDGYVYAPDSARRSDDESDLGAAGPVKLQFYNSVPRDSSGTVILAAPSTMAVGLGLDSTDPQAIDFGIAVGDYKSLAKGSTPVPMPTEGDSDTLAKGPWGRIEVTHLRRPMAESKPSPEYRFRLLGGVFPPKMERKVFLYNATGGLVATFGDGPNNSGYAGYAGFSRSGPTSVASFEIQERPYQFVRFDNICFDAPRLTAYSGEQGMDHALNSPMGQVFGVLRSTKDGAWSGSLLYAADGTRWIDPPANLTGYEYGMHDPWDHPLDTRLNILINRSPDFARPGTPISGEIHAADSPDGPDREKLGEFNEMMLTSPVMVISCEQTKRPYLRLTLNTGGGAWRNLQHIPVTERMLHSAESGPLGEQILTIDIHEDDGTTIAASGASPIHVATEWRPNSQRIRLLGHLRSGGDLEIQQNSSGFSGTDPTKHLMRGWSVSHQANGTKMMVGFKWVSIQDFTSFDLQSQELNPATTFSVHSPVERTSG
jgi:hypothetical protein